MWIGVPTVLPSGKWQWLVTKSLLRSCTLVATYCTIPGGGLRSESGALQKLRNLDVPETFIESLAPRPPLESLVIRFAHDEVHVVCILVNQCLAAARPSPLPSASLRALQLRPELSCWSTSTAHSRSAERGSSTFLPSQVGRRSSDGRTDGKLQSGFCCNRWCPHRSRGDSPLADQRLNGQVSAAFWPRA